jgi:hypothetical protein
MSATVTIFSSIKGIAQRMHDADPTLQIEVIEDQALEGCGGTIRFDPSSLGDDAKLKLKRAKILIAEPAVIT